MTKQRDYSMDLLKFLASFGVVMIHVDANFRYGQFAPNTPLWDVSLAINLFTKWCIPIFVMISGYYLLNSKKEMTYNEFLKKRFTKVLIPFIIWSIIYNIYYQYIGEGISIKWIGIGLIKNLLGYPTAAPLWFLYPLIALYLMTPIFKKILEAIDTKMILILIGFTIMIKTIVPLTDVITNGQTNYWKDVPIANTAFAMYFILGGYLGRIELKKKTKVSIYITSIIAFVLGIVMTYKVDLLYSRSIEVMLDISAINNMLVCISLFLIFKDMKFAKMSNNKIFVGTINFFSAVNFGVFLLHPIIIDLVKAKFISFNGSLITMMLLQSLIVYAITSLVVYIISKLQQIIFKKNYIF